MRNQVRTDEIADTHKSAVNSDKKENQTEEGVDKTDDITPLLTRFHHAILARNGDVDEDQRKHRKKGITE